MTNPRTLALTALASTPSRRFDRGRSSGRLQMVCIVTAFWIATAMASSAQSFTTVHSFAGFPTEGAWSHTGLMQAANGNFYGTTLYGGAGNFARLDGNGTVFKITPGGTLTMLYSFCAQPNCTDGGGPSTLIQATDGDFYGTTLYGGAPGNGTVFKITPGAHTDHDLQFLLRKGMH
jgi:uncharacterized repeat protein (TIGR03803 family)